MRSRLIAASFVLVALTACDSGTTSSPGAGATSTPSESATPSASPDTTASPTASGTMLVPVYYVAEAERRMVLFREFRSVERSSGVVRAAVDAMLHLAPLDTDYRSLWPAATTVLGVSTSGSVATVDLSGNARSASAGADAEKASLQQLVHTVTAAAPSITGVRLRFDGATEETLWGHADTRGTLTRAPQVDTLAPIWVVEPAHHATVSRTFRVTGVATVFEATVSWRVTRPGSTTALAQGHVNASQGGPGRGDFAVDVTLPAGTTGDVVFTAYEASAQDGHETYPDTKTYTVR